MTLTFYSQTQTQTLSSNNLSYLFESSSYIMEENEHENENSREFNSNIPMKTKTFSHADDQYHHSLFSTLITLYILILLYSPRHVTFKFILSPVIFIALILLLTLLRFGATQEDETKETNKQANCTNTTTTGATRQISNFNFDHEDHEWVTCPETRSFKPDPSFEYSFVEWNVRAPLEVIYEAYEGEEEQEQENKGPHNNEQDRSAFMLERYPSLSLCYPSDSDSSVEDDFLAIGNWGSPESVSFKWEDEEDREGLIEIALDGVHSNNNKRELTFDVEIFHDEEENNLIEIDIFSGE